MNILKPSFELVPHTVDPILRIEEAARTCYLSEPKDTPELRDEFMTYDPTSLPVGSSTLVRELTFEQWVREKFVTKLRKMGHQTPFEFADIEVVFIVDRGVSHEYVRHRMCSPMQESTRYCDYSENGHGINVIRPFFFDSYAPQVPVKLPQIAGFQLQMHDSKGIGLAHVQLNNFDIWFACMQFAEWGYQSMLANGASPQEARSVLPNSLKTKLRVKANVREWWHILRLRAVNTGAHPQAREAMIPVLDAFADRWPVLFDWLREGLDRELKKSAKPKTGD